MYPRDGSLRPFWAVAYWLDLQTTPSASSLLLHLQRCIPERFASRSQRVDMVSSSQLLYPFVVCCRLGRAPSVLQINAASQRTQQGAKLVLHRTMCLWFGSSRNKIGLRICKHLSCCKLWDVLSLCVFLLRGEFV